MGRNSSAAAAAAAPPQLLLLPPFLGVLCMLLVNGLTSPLRTNKG